MQHSPNYTIKGLHILSLSHSYTPGRQTANLYTYSTYQNNIQILLFLTYLPENPGLQSLLENSLGSWKPMFSTAPTVLNKRRLFISSTRVRCSNWLRTSTSDPTRVILFWFMLLLDP